MRVVVSGALLAGTLTLLGLRPAGEAVPIRKLLDAFPSTLDDWHGRETMVFDTETLNVLKPKDYLMRRYEDGAGRSIWLYLAYWDTQRKGAQPHSPKNCLPGGGWEPLEASLATIPLSRSHPPITVNRYLIQKGGDQQLVFYWYQYQGRAIAGEIAARIQMVRNGLFRNRTDGALVRVSGPIQDSVARTEARLTAYIQAMYPFLGEYLPD